MSATVERSFAGRSVEDPPVAAPTSSTRRPLAFFFTVGLLIACGVATQYAAARLGYHPNLGRPIAVPSADTVRMLRAAAILAAGGALSATVARRTRWIAPALLLVGFLLYGASRGPIYEPYRLFIWYRAYDGVAALAPVFRTAVVVLFAAAIANTVLIVTLARRLNDPPRRTSHGTAHWDDGEGLHSDNGLILGRLDGRLLRYPGRGHVLTVAPTRSGKGVGSVIPNLLDYAGSVFVTDPKGENVAVTAARRRALRQDVHVLDPFGVSRDPAAESSFNPFDLLHAESLDLNDDAWMLADMLVIPDTKAGEQVFWNEEGKGLLAGLIMHVATAAPPELRTLTYVRRLLTLPPDDFRGLLAEMSASAAVDGLVARAAARLAQKADKERSGVVSSAQSHTHFLDSPRMTAVMKASTFSLDSLKAGKTSVYLVLPPERLDTYSRWLRLMIACGLLAAVRTPGRPRQPVLFLLDEFAHLGRMAPVQRDIALVGGYGVSFWLLVQDLAQLKSIYSDQWQTFLSNSDVLQAFGTADWDTAEYLSKMTGEATIRVRNENRSRGVSRGRHLQRQDVTAFSVNEKARRLLLPDEVRRLGRDRQLLFMQGRAPLLTERVSYLVDREFAGIARANPLHEGPDDANAARAQK